MYSYRMFKDCCALSDESPHKATEATFVLIHGGVIEDQVLHAYHYSLKECGFLGSSSVDDDKRSQGRSGLAA